MIREFDNNESDCNIPNLITPGFHTQFKIFRNF